MIDRRAFLRAALFVAAAPMIVKASSLMPVRALKEYPVGLFITEQSMWSNGSVDLTEESLLAALVEIRKFDLQKPRYYRIVGPLPS